ncbi:DUF1062 domain-containing protein [Clostridium sp. HBUAS56010]|uniref:DUF1062 domain-containing protein n=1 Tax=Clostridium sp. HBUAS56010 TaxID=2571127 RepID=UPI001177DA28|nr:DUF1062 domain-containing protein [Clostridium sp. HBUAS56010]
MKKIVWDIQCVSPPPAVYHCKKCGKKTEYVSSGQFRVNAQKKSLDIWLIYKCATCDSTWNVSIYSRVNPNSISRELLERFHLNDAVLAEDYAMDNELLRGNGAEVESPTYKIIGEDFKVTEPVELQIRSDYYFPVKVSVILKSKLQLSQNELLSLIEHEKVSTISKQKLRKLRLNKEITLLFNIPDTLNYGEETIQLCQK